MTEEELAAIEAEHIARPSSGGSVCASMACDYSTDRGDAYTDWPCDTARLVAEVRAARRSAQGFKQLVRDYGDEIIRLRTRCDVLRPAARNWVDMTGRQNVVNPDLLEAIV